MPFRQILMLLPGLFLLLSGCQGLQVKDKQARLEDTLRAYSGTVRWGNLADAYNFLEPELARQADPPPNLANIKVTRYKRLASPVLNQNTATVTARIRYIHQDRQIERNITDKQLWRFHDGKGWRRANPIPSFQ